MRAVGSVHRRWHIGVPSEKLFSLMPNRQRNKLVLSFAVEEEIIEVNPAARIKELKGGSYRSWTDDECTAFEKHWAPGTMQRRAYALGLYTGQRKADQVAMTKAHRSAGIIQVKQEKTNTDLWITEHSALAAELALGRARPHEPADDIERQGVRFSLLRRVVRGGN